MQLGKYGSLTVANQPVLIADHFIYRMTFSCQWAPRFSCCMNYHFSFLYAINRNGLIDSSSTCLYWFWHVSLITRAAKLSICISTGSIQYIWHVNVRRTHIKNHFSAIFFLTFFHCSFLCSSIEIQLDFLFTCHNRYALLDAHF